MKLYQQKTKLAGQDLHLILAAFIAPIICWSTKIIDLLKLRLSDVISVQFTVFINLDATIFSYLPEL